MNMYVSGVVEDDVHELINSKILVLTESRP